MKKKSTALLVSLVLLLTVSVGATLAFLIDTDDPITNTFTPSEVTVQVNETFDGTTKSNVSIKNTGDTEAYIRAAIIVTWQDANGNVYGQLPDEKKDDETTGDYTISFNTTEQSAYDNGKWIKGSDGFYYWSKPVKSEKEAASDCNTGILITEAKLVEGAKAPADNYYLCIEIIASGIQAEPKTAVESAWPAVKVGANGLEKKEG